MLGVSRVFTVQFQRYREGSGGRDAAQGLERRRRVAPRGGHGSLGMLSRFGATSSYRRRAERDATAHAAMTPKTPPVEEALERAPLVPEFALGLLELELPLALEFEGDVALPLAAELEMVAVGPG